MSESETLTGARARRAKTCSAAEILKEVRPYIEEGVGVHVIIKGLRMARDLVRSVDLRGGPLADRSRRSRRSRKSQ